MLIPSKKLIASSVHTLFRTDFIGIVNKDNRDLTGRSVFVNCRVHVLNHAKWECLCVSQYSTRRWISERIIITVQNTGTTFYGEVDCCDVGDVFFLHAAFAYYLNFCLVFGHFISLKSKNSQFVLTTFSVAIEVSFLQRQPEGNSHAALLLSPLVIIASQLSGDNNRWCELVKVKEGQKESLG